MWVEGHWQRGNDLLALRHIKAGEYDPQKIIPEDAFDYTIPFHMLPGLFEKALEEGLFVPKSPGREEDLKIIHRLIDILEKT